jgi:hypothetical protein
MLNNLNKVIIVFILLNIILYCIKKYSYKLHYYYNQLSSHIINVDCYNYNFILSKNCNLKLK